MAVKEVCLPCDDRCSIILFRIDDEDGLVYIEHYESSYYVHQEKWKNLLKYFKRLWFAIIGKRYMLYDMVVPIERFPFEVINKNHVIY